MLLRIHDQPCESKIGERLADLFRRAANGEFSAVTLVAAFAKRAGVRRLEPAIRAAKEGGATICAIVGIDHGVTTKEGVSDLFAISDDLFVVHSTRMDVTFHSKAYFFSGPARAALIIGSSNLTCGGMFTNIELCAEAEFDLPADAQTLGESTHWLCQLSDASLPHVVKLDDASLPALLALLPTEAAVNAAAGGPGGALGAAAAANLFGSGDFPPAPPLPARGGGQAVADDAAMAAPGAPVGTAIPAKGMWKMLSKFDTSPKSGPGSMIIPLAMVPVFPALGRRRKMPSGGYQADCEFLIRFIDRDIRKRTTARFIRYEPAPDHLRGNIEHRLAFHDRSINPDGLSKDDILFFESLAADPGGAVFNVRRIQPGNPAYRRLTDSGRRFGVLP